MMINTVSILSKMWQFFAHPFQRKEEFPGVPWSAKDGLIVVLLSTFLLSFIVFGGFYLGGWLVDNNFLSAQSVVNEEKLNIDLGAALELEVLNGFDIMSLFVLEHFSLLVVIGVLLQVAIQTTFLFLYSFYKYGANMVHFGFRTLPIKTLLLMVGGMFLLSMLIQNGYISFLNIVGIEDAYKNGEAEQMILDKMLPLPVLILFIGVAAPVLEEIMFRGVFLTGLLKKNSMLLALIISSALFALMHLDFSAFVSGTGNGGIHFIMPSISELVTIFSLMPIYFLLGMLLGFAFLRTKSLYPGIVFHMINNNAALVLLLMSLEKSS
jgi:membrane protease YdiL (CAAX protease family)